MEVNVGEIISQHMSTIVWVCSGMLIYLLYRWFFNGIVYRTKGPKHERKNMGRPLPPYPNGWFVVAHSESLKNGQSKNVDVNGENLVVFRSKKGVAYILEAYCLHLGANLGIGGEVVNEKCIQCPFHGWLYDGETGLCVSTSFFYCRPRWQTREG